LSSPGNLRARRAAIALLWLSAVVTILYWVVFFSSGEVHLENGMYTRMNAAMAGEVVINLWCVSLGPFLLVYFWRHRRDLKTA